MEPSRKSIVSPSSNQQVLSSTPQSRQSSRENQTSQKPSTTQRDQASRSQQRQQQLRLQLELQQKQQQLQQQKQQQQLQQQKQQQQQQKRDQSPDVLTVHVRTQQPPLTKPKPRHYEEIKNTSSSHEKQKQQQKSGKSDNKHRQSKGGNTTDQDKNIRGVNVNSRNSKQHLVPSHHNLSSDISGSHVVTSQPRPPRAKRTSATPCGKDNTTNNSSSISKRKESKNPNKSKEKQREKQNMTGSLTQNMKPSRNSVGALEAGIPERFCDTPDNKETISTSTRVAATAGSTTTEPNDKKSTKKLPNHDLTDIPQTNLSVGLIVFCCFNPLFGAMSIYLSLSAAKAYRDGRESKGNSRAHWSILVSLFGITVTMVIVSSIVVVFSMGKHSNSDYRQATSQALGF